MKDLGMWVQLHHGTDSEALGQQGMCDIFVG